MNLYEQLYKGQLVQIYRPQVKSLISIVVDIPAKENSFAFNGSSILYRSSLPTDKLIILT